MKKIIIDGIEYIPKGKEIETWIDPDTGLIWEKQGSEKGMIWNEAIKYAETLGDNWRLPTIHELFSLIDFSRDNPACKITNFYSATYWSSTTRVNETNIVWIVYFGSGYVSGSIKDNNYFVRCVKKDKK